MKRALITFSLAMMALLGLQADNIRTGSLWYCGTGQYEATNAGSFIRMYSMSEGEESVFKLVPVDEDWQSFTIRPAEGFEDAFYPMGTSAKRVDEEGQSVILVYDDQNHLTTVFRQTMNSVETNTIQTRIGEIRGCYSQDSGKPDVLIADHHISIGSVDYAYEVWTFNGFATNFISIKDGAWRGLWELKATREGWNVYECLMNEYGYPEHKPGGRKSKLTWNDSESSRWDFASQMILTDAVLYHFTKSSLRLMRNAILARHGYVFSSSDLRQYFDAQPWYAPRESNDDIHLSFVEQLNVALIKYSESSDDHNERASQE